MDIAPYLEMLPAPRWVFARLDERRDRPRYQVPTADGGWRPVSWGEHADEIRDLASFLLARGHRPGQHGAIFAHNRVQWMSAALGLQAAGMVVVPVYPASTTEQLSYVVQHCQAQILFVAGADLLERVFQSWSALDSVEVIVVLDDTDPTEVLEQADDHGDRMPSSEEVERKLVHFSVARAAGAEHHRVHPSAFEKALHGIDMEQPAVMLYTSGTTGNPKGVPLTHHNLAANGADWIRCNGPRLHEHAIDLFWLPMSHIFGFGEACFGNMLGWTSYMAEPSNVVSLMPKIAPSVFMSVPAYWEKLAKPALGLDDPQAQQRAVARATGGRLRFCLSGGAGFDRAVKELFHRAGTLIIEGYGLTECSPTLTLNRPDDFRFDSVGKPTPSVELKLAEDGEILARGPNVFKGYHRDPQATAAAFTDDGWFKTGDIGRFTDDGFLQIVDRKKEILVTAGGKNVPPANIERLFASDPMFSHVVVYGDGKKYLVAGIWLDDAVVAERLRGQDDVDDPEQAVQALVQRAVDAANAKLARFEQIKRFTIMPRALRVQDGMLTSTLKVRRKKIYEAFRDDYEAMYR